MVQIAPDNGGVLNNAGLQPVGFVNPALMISQPTAIYDQARATANLQQLNSQVGLEMAERKADLATAQFKQQGTQYLLDNMGTVNQQQYTDLMAKILTNQSVAATARNSAATASSFADNGGTTAAGAAQALAAKNAGATEFANFTSGFSSQPTPVQSLAANAYAGTGSLLGQWGQIPTFATPTSLAPSNTLLPQSGIQDDSAPLSNGPGTVTAPVLHGGTTPGTPSTATPKTVQAVPAGAAAPVNAQPGASGGTASPVPQVGTGGFTVNSVNPALTGMMQGIRNAAYLDATTDAHTLEVPNYPYPGVTSTIFQRVSKSDGSVVSQSAPVVTKNDATRLVQRSAQDIVNLQTSNNLVGNVQTALNKWKSTYPAPGGLLDFIKDSVSGRGFQAAAATAATQPTTGVMSLIEKGIGGWAESKETRDLVGAIQVYNQSLIKLDPDTQKGASAIGLSVGDLVAPDQLQKKLDGAKDYAAARLKTFQDDNILSRVNPGAQTQAPEAGQAAAPGTGALAPTHVIKLKDGTTWNATLNPDGSYQPLSQVK